jgi:hypothetical protein
MTNLILLSCLYLTSILSFAGQMVITPIFIDSFKEEGGMANPYFVIILSALSQTLLCVFCYPHKIPLLFKLPRGHHQLLFGLGFYWALSYVIVAIGSSGDRTPVDLQAIFSQTNIPFTFMLSYCLLRSRQGQRQQRMSILIVFGTLLTLIPTFVDLHNESYAKTALLWCLIYLGGMLINSMSLIYNEKVYANNEYSVSLYQLNCWANFYQLVISLSLFWVNFIPFVGTSSSFSNWRHDLAISTHCFFHCPTSGYKGIIFILAVTIGSVVSTIVIKVKSANCLTLINSLAPPISITYWAFASDLSPFRLVMNYVGAIVIILAILWGERPPTDPTKGPLDDMVDDDGRSFQTLSPSASASINLPTAYSEKLLMNDSPLANVV